MDAGVQLSEVYSTIEKLQEVNPMLGFRGCRLGITYPEITEMQVREAISAFGHQGHTGCAWVPLPEPGHTHVISCFHWGQVTLSDLVINVLLLGVRLLANPPPSSWLNISTLASNICRLLLLGLAFTQHSTSLHNTATCFPS